MYTGYIEGIVSFTPVCDVSADGGEQVLQFCHKMATKACQTYVIVIENACGKADGTRNFENCKCETCSRFR